jgi:hypothetical protein
VKTIGLIGAAIALALGAGLAQAAPPGGSAGVKVSSQATKTSLTPAERGELARAFVLKWGDYAQQVYGLDVKTWSKRMVGTFASADPANFQNALRRSTYEGALATLDGAGYKVTDSEVINALAASLTGTIAPYALGDLDQDLVFTAVEPCRLLDTRSASAGIVTAGSTRGVRVWGFTTLAIQGGDPAGCGLSDQSPQAIVVNVTAVLPAATGFATLFPANGTLPLAATMLYTAGGVLSNGATVKLGTVGVSDFNLFSERTSNYVVDIVGYFDAPFATELECVQSVLPLAPVLAGAIFNRAIPACPTGYKITGAGCRTTGFNQASWSVNGLFDEPNTAFCAGQNTTAGSISVGGSSQCCRVPGR